MSRTHYRKVYKSNHLGQADIEDFIESGSNLIFTIDHVKQEYGVAVAGRKGDHNIAYFKENIKPWVINATNGTILRKFAGGSPIIEDWSNIIVQLYIDPNVKMKGDVVGGVRVRPQQPRTTKEVLTPDSGKRWTGAIEAYKRDGNLDKVLAKVDMSEAHQKLIKDTCDAE